MTTPKDSQAVLRANELLADSDATVDALRDVQQALRAEMGEMDKLPRIDLSTALSVTQHREMEGEKRDRELRYEILRRLSFGLNEAIRKRRAADAIAGADESRAALQKALDKAEKARSEYNAATRDALAKADVIAKGRDAAGHHGHDKVGATPEQIDMLQDLAEPLLEGVALKRLRLTTQLGDPSKVA